MKKKKQKKTNLNYRSVLPRFCDVPASLDHRVSDVHSSWDAEIGALNTSDFGTAVVSAVYEHRERPAVREPSTVSAQQYGRDPVARAPPCPHHSLPCNSRGHQ